MKRWVRDERGATSIEYALICTFVAVVVVAAIAAAGTSLNTVLNNVSSGFSP